jgi:hypothetical protein
VRASTALVFMLAGCGRVGFSPLADGTVAGDGASGTDSSGSADAVDSDGDGVPDSSDNCVMVPNPAQHDEDADAVGDVCDNCPTVANASQANAGEINAGMTADALGDACDPRPTLPGDSILYFDPFVGALRSDWTVVNGTWTATGDALEQAATTASDQRIHDSAIAVNDYLVETTFKFAALDAGNVNGGLVFHMGGGNGWLCGVFRDDTTTPVTSDLMIWTIQNGAANFEKASATIAEPMPGDRVRVFAGAYGSSLYCALDSPVTGTSAPFTSNQNATGVPGLRTNRVSGSYEYVIVYGLGGPI